MISKKLAVVPQIDPDPTAKYSIVQASPVSHIYREYSLVPWRLHSCKSRLNEFPKIVSAVAVDFSIIILISLDHIFLSLSLRMNSQRFVFTMTNIIPYFCG